MKKLILILLFTPLSSVADDALINPVAKKIKSQIIKILHKQGHDDLSGFCDLMLEMRHQKAHVKVHRIKTSGDSKLCKAARRAVPKKRYRYKEHEKFIRIQISF